MSLESILSPGSLPFHHLTKDEVSLHHKSNDCWLIINDKVYDLNRWENTYKNSHPGGEIIKVLAGEDATAMFYSCHFSDLTCYLKPLEIGQLENNNPEFQSYNDVFFKTLKSRVEFFLREKRINLTEPKINYSTFIFMVILFLMLWLSMYLLKPWGFLLAIPMGLMTCSFIGRFGHEHIHSNFIRSKNFFIFKNRFPILYNLINNLAWGILIPAMPEKYFQYEHIKHHQSPMNSENDYDVFALKELIRLSPDGKKKSLFKFQHLYAPLVYAFYIFLQIRGGFSTKFFKQRKPLFDKGVLKNLIITSTVSIVFHIALPIYFSGFKYFILCGTLYLVTWQSAIYISSGVPHMTDLNSLIKKQNESWPLFVCQTTKNLKCGNWFIDWLTGGLNYHIEHHLLPSIPRQYLPTIQPIVERTCAEFGYPYKIYSSFREYYRDHYRFLFELGNKIH